MTSGATKMQVKGEKANKGSKRYQATNQNSECTGPQELGGNQGLRHIGQAAGTVLIDAWKRRAGARCVTRLSYVVKKK